MEELMEDWKIPDRSHFGIRQLIRPDTGLPEPRPDICPPTALSTVDMYGFDKRPSSSCVGLRRSVLALKQVP